MNGNSSALIAERHRIKSFDVKQHVPTPKS